MAKLKGLKLKQLSEAVNVGFPVPIEKISQRLQDIREALGITQKQLAKKLKISQPLLSKIEENAESCSLKTVLHVASGLDCDFLGVISSRDTLLNKIRKQAENKAQNMLKRTFANMAMEQQSPEKSAYDYQLKQLIEEMVANPGPELWEE